jgi:hypothetical protein
MTQETVPPICPECGTARKAIEAMVPAPIKVLSIPEGHLITAGAVTGAQDFEEEEF